MPSDHTCNDKNSVAYDGARQGWFAQGFNIWISPTLQSLHNNQRDVGQNLYKSRITFAGNLLLTENTSKEIQNNCENMRDIVSNIF